MSRLTEKLPTLRVPRLSEYAYRVNVFGGYVEEDKKENAVWLFHNIVEKLAEYENLGSVEEVVQKMHELEVYKRALKNEIPSNYYELEKVKNEEQYIDLRLDQARKELEDERN